MRIALLLVLTKSMSEIEIFRQSKTASSTDNPPATSHDSVYQHPQKVRFRAWRSLLVTQELLTSSRTSLRCRSGEMNRFLFSARMAMTDMPTHRAKKARPATGLPSTPPRTKRVNVTRTMIAELTGTPSQSRRFLNWKKSASRVYSLSTWRKTSGIGDPGLVVERPHKVLTLRTRAMVKGT